MPGRRATSVSPDAASGETRGPADLQDRADVVVLVDAFYRRVFEDPMIGPIFTDVARMDLDHHLPIITDFWDTVLFNSQRYRRDLLQLHLALNRRFPLEARHFERWLALWSVTVDEHFAGRKAELAKTQGRRIAGSIYRRVHGRSASDFETLQRRDVAERTAWRDPRPSAGEDAEQPDAEQHEQHDLDQLEQDVPPVEGVAGHGARRPPGEDPPIHPGP
jgi:hemoglobin